MFTGIVRSQGVLVELRAPGGARDGQLAFEDALAPQLAVGDSVAVNGVCLSAVERRGERCRVDVSAATWRATALGSLSLGERVNLELPARLDSVLGGHLVSGHVDGVAETLRIDAVGESMRFGFRAPATLARYIASKGSVCLDGVSLTVNRVEGAEFEVNIIPHTLRSTRFAGYQLGSLVNLEVDLVARYIERLVDARADMPTTSRDAEAGRKP